MNFPALERPPRLYIVLLLVCVAGVAVGAGVVVAPRLAMAAFVLLICGMTLLAIPAGYISLIAAGILIALATAFPVTASETLLEIGPASGVFALAAVAIALAFMVMIRGGLRRTDAWRFLLLVAAFIGIYALATLASERENLIRLAPHAALWASAAVVGSSMPRRHVKPLLIFIALIAAAEAGLALVEVLFKVKPPLSSFIPDSTDPSWAFVGDTPRARGTFGHSVPLAAFLTASLATVWWLWPRAPHRFSVLRFPLFVLLVGGIMASFSRSSWIALIVLLAVFLGSRRTDSRQRLLLLAFLLCLAIAILSGGMVTEAVSGRLEGTVQSGSYLQRMAGLTSVPAILSADAFHALLGNGFNGRFILYAEGILQNVGNFEAIDNQFVSLLVDVGLLGSGVFIVIVAMAWSRLRSREYSSQDTGASAPVATVLRYALLPLLITAFFFENLFWPSNAVLLWLVIGLAISYAGAER